MKRVAFRILIPVFTFLLGFAAHLAWSYLQVVNSELAETEARRLAQRLDFPSPERNQISFRFNSCAEGNEFTATGYESSDGVQIGLFSRSCSSRKEATNALEEQAREATEIIERVPKLDAEGQQAGERVVALFYGGDPEIQRAAVFWTNGSSFESIDSPSLQHTLKFEKYLMKKNL